MRLAKCKASPLVNRKTKARRVSYKGWLLVGNISQSFCLPGVSPIPSYGEGGEQGKAEESMRVETCNELKRNHLPGAHGYGSASITIIVSTLHQALAVSTLWGYCPWGYWTPKMYSPN